MASAAGAALRAAAAKRRKLGAATGGAVVVIGGSGFIGTHVLMQLVAKGVPTVSVSRSGAAPKHLDKASWAEKVTWATGDALDQASYAHHLRSTATRARAVVVCVGTPLAPNLDDEQAVTVNGSTNCAVLEAAARAVVDRVVLVSALVPQWAPPGYANGKKMAEECVVKFVEGSSKARGAVVLKPGAMPGAVVGTKHTESGHSIPLAPLLAPVQWALSSSNPLGLDAAAKAAREAGQNLGVDVGSLLVPPVDVKVLATAAVDGATDDAFAGAITIRDAFDLTAE